MISSSEWFSEKISLAFTGPMGVCGDTWKIVAVRVAVIGVRWFDFMSVATGLNSSCMISSSEWFSEKISLAFTGPMGVYGDTWKIVAVRVAVIGVRWIDFISHRASIVRV